MSKIKPFYQIEVNRNLFRQLTFSEIEISEYQWKLKARYKLYSFPGQTCTVCCITNQEDVSVDDCLKMAVRFVKGEYVTVYVDLNLLESVVTKGVPHPPP